VTARTDLLSRTDRKRLLERLDELAALEREMRRPGTLARPGTSPDDTPSRRPPGRTEKEGPTP
jgi:hypothetical protein